MTKTLSKNEMINELLSDQYATWTYDEAEALVNFYEMHEDELSEAIEFDSVAIRCEWNKATEKELREMYHLGGSRAGAKEYLDYHGYCIEVGDKLLFRGF